MEKLLCILVAVLGVQLCCGTPLAVSMDVGSRVIDGSPATESQFPWAISLQKKSLILEPTRGHECGGALITLRQAVTSGSCLYIDTGNSLKEAAEYRVLAGRIHLTDDASPESWRDVEEFMPHPDYSGPLSYINDIGIIILANAFQENAALAPIALAQEDPEERTWCDKAGWGAKSIQDIQASVELHYVSRYVVNQVGCVALSEWAGGPAIQSHMLCGGMTAVFTPSCTYDSGNALVCNGALAAVLSWHRSDCSIYHNVETYTRIPYFLSWIKEFMDEEEDTSSEEEEEDPGAAPPSPALTLALVVVTALAHLFYRNSVLNM